MEARSSKCVECSKRTDALERVLKVGVDSRKLWKVRRFYPTVLTKLKTLPRQVLLDYIYYINK